MTRNIIEEFKIYGEDVEDTWDYIGKIEVTGELESILKVNTGEKLLEKLFMFSMKYGVISFVKFLYEHVNYAYDSAIISDFAGMMKEEKKPDTMMGQMVAVGDGGGGPQGELKYTVSDKYSKKRNECIAYLVHMRKYSEYASKNRRFYYRYKKEKYGGKK